MRALVLGAGGFVGRHMARRLCVDGYEVDAIDLVRPPTHPNNTFRWLTRNVREWFLGLDAMRHYDLVVHCAAVVGGREMIDGSPLHVAAENLSLDADLFRWALRTRPGRIVYFSSSAAYPVAFQVSEADGPYGLSENEMDPDYPLLPDQTYGWVKLTGERLAQEANDAGIKTHVFRPFSGYGEDQSLDYPFPSFIDRAVRRADPFDIWGDGTQVRDWIHIDDIVGGVMAAIESDVLGPVNLGTGIGWPMLDVVGFIGQAVNWIPFVKLHPEKPTGVQYRVADPTLLHTFYTPKVSLEEGISRSIRATTPQPAPRS